MRSPLFISIFFLLFTRLVFAQNWTGTTTPTSTGDYNTLIQLTHNTWGSHHGILFNATRRVPYNDGNLLDNGNVLHAFATGPYGSGAGAIMFLGNGGSMEFLVSPASNGAGQPVDWGGPKLTIQRNGFVGVGTNSPASKLHVHNDNLLPQPTGSNVLLSRLSGRAHNIFMRNEWLVRDNNATADWITARFHDGISIDASFLNPRVDTRVWWERDPLDNIQSWGDQGNTYMTINSGNVGIGTTTPDAKLAVKGTVHAQEVKVDLSVPGPDYVFNDDYKLLSLEEIKTYIDKNKHLPEVPNAKVMEANGVNLGEMNMLLLKKIEELTLHLIEQNELINKLIMDSENQQSEIEKLKTLVNR